MKILVFGMSLVSYIGLIQNIKQVTERTNRDKDKHQNKYKQDKKQKIATKSTDHTVIRLLLIKN